MTQYEYSIGPTGRIVIAGSLEAAVDEARRALEALGEHEKPSNEAQKAHIYADHGEGHRFVGYVKASGQFIDQRA